MPDNFKVEDVRKQKTNVALIDAMTKLLELRSFNQITVNDLCKEAQIGRTAFYSHFQDKYDLLKSWFIKIKPSVVSERSEYKDTGKRIGDFVNNNGKIMRHLIDDANSETLGLLCDFILSLLDMDKANDAQNNPQYTVLSKFYCGGITNYLQWQATNKSKSDSNMMNAYFYDILDALYKWNREQK